MSHLTTGSFAKMWQSYLNLRKLFFVYIQMIFRFKNFEIFYTRPKKIKIVKIKINVAIAQLDNGAWYE